MKNNCWEVNGCNRGLGCLDEKNQCPTAIEAKLNGVHGGNNGGRVCWAIAGTYCRGEKQGSFVAKVKTCVNCPFYLLVAEEEGAEFRPIKEILNMLNG